MQYSTFTTFLFVTLASHIAAAPISTLSLREIGLERRLDVTTPGGIVIGTDDDVNGVGELSPIEDGFLEFDNDAGGETGNGGTAVGVANGALGQGGAGSASQNEDGSGSTSSYCSEWSTF